MAEENANSETVEVSDKDKELLKEIREDYRHFLDYWRENREEMEVCMRFADGDAFTKAERDFREGLKRPCETPDELSQYVKQTNNDLRKTKRDAKIVPSSGDATQEDAEKREAILRGLNHRGNFQAVFQTAFEQCTWCAFGFLGISVKYTDSTKQHMEPRPRRIANQFSVLLDPYAKEADYSDQKKCFVVDVMRQSDFAKAYPKAQKKSFSTDDSKIAVDFIKGDQIVVAEAWRVESDKVVQYTTNGIELLPDEDGDKRIEWLGSWIPIIPILGEEIYVSDGGRNKRKYKSLISRARVAQKGLAFLFSQMIEEFGQAPRTKYIGYDGQFTSPDWATLNTDPRAWISVPAVPDPTDPNKVLPLPTLVQFNPHAQEYQLSMEGLKRSIQAEIGVVPLPQSAQKEREKSGIAIEKIEDEEENGSYHFLDNANRAHVNYARQMNELVTKLMLGPRQVGVKNKDESHGSMHVLSGDHPMPEKVDPKNVLYVDRGEYDVTFTIGPSEESERQEQADFVDLLIREMAQLPIPDPIKTKILAIAVRMKNIGHLGDEIADLLDPAGDDPNAKLQQMMQAAAQQQQLMGEMQTELQTLQMEREGKVIEKEYEVRLKNLTIDFEKWKVQVTLDNQRAIAQIQTKAQMQMQREQNIHEVDAELHSAAHEVGLSAQEHQQELAATSHEASLQPVVQPSEQNGDGEGSAVRQVFGQ